MTYWMDWRWGGGEKLSRAKWMTYFYLIGWFLRGIRFEIHQSQRRSFSQWTLALRCPLIHDTHFSLLLLLLQYRSKPRRVGSGNFQTCPHRFWGIQMLGKESNRAGEWTIHPKRYVFCCFFLLSLARGREPSGGVFRFVYVLIVDNQCLCYMFIFMVNVFVSFT